MQKDEDKSSMKNRGKKHPIVYKSNPSGQLLIEESLKAIVNKSRGLGYKASMSKMAPRNKHSPFGDFPAEYMPQKAENFDLDSIDNHQVSSCVKGNSNTGRLRKPFEKADRIPISGAFNPRKIEKSSFRLHYDRGDLPIMVKHTNGYSIKWKVDDFEHFDYQLYLPIFIEGIREKTDPYRFLAIQGTFDLLANVKDNIVKVIPQLILPLKKALNSRDKDIIVITLKV